MGEIVALIEQRRVVQNGACIGKAIAHIERRTVPALTEIAECIQRHLSLGSSNSDNLDRLKG